MSIGTRWMATSWLALSLCALGLTVHTSSSHSQAMSLQGSECDLGRIQQGVFAQLVATSQLDSILGFTSGESGGDITWLEATNPANSVGASGTVRVNTLGFGAAQEAKVLFSHSAEGAVVLPKPNPDGDPTARYRFRPSKYAQFSDETFPDDVRANHAFKLTRSRERLWSAEIAPSTKLLATLHLRGDSAADIVFDIVSGGAKITAAVALKKLPSVLWSTAQSPEGLRLFETPAMIVVDLRPSYLLAVSKSWVLREALVELVRQGREACVATLAGRADLRTYGQLSSSVALIGAVARYTESISSSDLRQDPQITQSRAAILERRLSKGWFKSDVTVSTVRSTLLVNPFSRQAWVLPTSLSISDSVDSRYQVLAKTDRGYILTLDFLADQKLSADTERAVRERLSGMGIDGNSSFQIMYGLQDGFSVSLGDYLITVRPLAAYSMGDRRARLALDLQSQEWPIFAKALSRSPGYPIELRWESQRLVEGAADDVLRVNAHLVSAFAHEMVTVSAKQTVFLLTCGVACHSSDNTSVDLHYHSQQKSVVFRKGDRKPVQVIFNSVDQQSGEKSYLLQHRLPGATSWRTSEGPIVVIR